MLNLLTTLSKDFPPEPQVGTAREIQSPFAFNTGNRAEGISSVDIGEYLSVEKTKSGSYARRESLSSLRAATVHEKRTLPRSCRRVAYVRDATNSRSPATTVSVRLVPVAWLAFSRRSRGTVTVI